jgi:D-3-phosphoglycerate dehydrogenase
MTKLSVAVTDHDFEDLGIEREVLNGVATIVDVENEVGKADLGTDDLLSTADAILVHRAEICADAIARLEDCRVIARYGIGVDNVAITAAADRGIPVTNVPDYCLEEVATHALSMLLSLSRGLKQYDASVAAGEWDRGAATPLHRFSTWTVGVIGYGAIGREVGARAAALGAEVLASDPFLDPKDLVDDPATLTSFEELCDRANAVTVHSPLTADTIGQLDAEAFARLDDDAVVVNVARGPIVDIDDLHNAIADGELAGAGLDVFPEEPPAPGHPLLDHPQVITTPHVAWYSEEAGADRRRRAAGIVRDALTGNDVANVVNGV